MEQIIVKLLPYQVPHVNNIANSLRKYNRALDCSDTGTGKTYATIAACAILGFKPLVICPKSVIPNWIKVIETDFAIEYYGVTNYESLQNCKMFHKDQVNKINCPFITRIEVEKPPVENNYEQKKKKINKKDKEEKTKFELEKEKVYTFKWHNLPDDLIVIFDEAHRCKNVRTSNSVILCTLAQHAVKILMLSATISESVEKFAAAGLVLGLYGSFRLYNNWLDKLTQQNPGVLQMKIIHDIIFNEYASRMKIKELGKLFPDNKVIADCYNMDEAPEIEAEYKLIEAEVEKLKRKEQNSGCALAAILYARMRIETLKIPTIKEEALKFLEEGNSVAIFVNFTNSVRTLADEFKTNCIIFGEQTLEERNKAIEDFMTDKSRIIICNTRSGGVGVSLHDTNGNFPRVSIISPGWSSQDIIQALGRIHRANGKTPVRQYILFCQATVEEKVCDALKDKIRNTGLLNDGDFDTYKIEGWIDDEELTCEMREMPLIERLFLQLETMQNRKARLTAEITECDKEIDDITSKIHALV